MDLEKFSDPQLSQLIDSRWASSDTVWDIVDTTYDTNMRIYKNEPAWMDSDKWYKNKPKIKANRIFRDEESVINALIANPPKPNVIQTRNTEESKELALSLTKFFTKKYEDRNFKEINRKGLRNLYAARLIVIKPFWNAQINDFDAVTVDPRKVRFSSTSTKEQNSEFAIEKIGDELLNVIARFPTKQKEILTKLGYAVEGDAIPVEAYIKNPSIVYEEAWIGEWLVCKYGNIILSKGKNPYWDWDGLMVTKEEYAQLSPSDPREEGLNSVQRKNLLSTVRQQQPNRQPQKGQEEMAAYYFNHFDTPRKPYIFATILNNENCPIGQTDFITQAAPLQEGIDRRKVDIDENATLVNGVIKVEKSSMSKADAEKLNFNPRGVIWGDGVKDGVTRETGTALPQFVYEDMVDSRNEIDNIMGASSAFRGEREGQETKAGRLALIDQSFLNLNELVQVVDYVNSELFNWCFQLAKTRYTEHHFAKMVGKDQALEIVSLIQDDFEDGTEIKIIAGKSLPEDRQFKYEQAQMDVEKGILSPVDYFEEAGYATPDEKARNRVKYNINPAVAVGISEEEMMKLSPPVPPPEPDKPSRSISFKDLPVDGKIQLAEQADINLNPQLLVAQELKQNADKERERDDKLASEDKQIKAKSSKD